MSDTEVQAELIAEQLRHTIDMLRAEIASLHAEQAHAAEFADHRLKALEAQAADHESRLRSVSDGVTQFKVWSGLASSGSSLMAVAALIKAWMGG